MPGAGKTTLAEALAPELGWPLLAKDAIKERLFDELGAGDRAWSQALGRVAFAVLYDTLGRLLAAGTPAVVDANLARGAAEPDVGGLPPHAAIQVVCRAPADVLRARWRRRTTRGERHPGHLDAELEATLEETLRAGVHGALDVPGAVLELDTAVPVDVRALAARIRTLSS